MNENISADKKGREQGKNSYLARGIGEKDEGIVTRQGKGIGQERGDGDGGGVVTFIHYNQIVTSHQS